MCPRRGRVHGSFSKRVKPHSDAERRVEGLAGTDIGEARLGAKLLMPKSSEPCREVHPKGATGGGNATDEQGRHIISVRNVLYAETEGEMVVDLV